LATRGVEAAVAVAAAVTEAVASRNVGEAEREPVLEVTKNVEAPVGVAEEREAVVAAAVGGFVVGRGTGGGDAMGGFVVGRGTVGGFVVRRGTGAGVDSGAI